MERHAWLFGLLLSGTAGLAVAQQDEAAPHPATASLAPYRSASVAEEIALARSAAPPSISADAEVLVLGEHGYEVAAQGSNGFVCFVERSWAAGFDDPQFWNPQGRAPNCFNAAAVRSVLPQYLKRAEWVMAGASREQMVEKAKAAFASGEFVAPEPGAFSFMLSKQGYVDLEAGGPWLPHLMFFVPHGTAAAWGAGLEGSPVLGGDGGPFEPGVLFVPVRRWSDGTPAPPPPQPEHHHAN